MDGGGTRTYWRGLQTIVPAGKDEMPGHPGALGGSRYQQLPHKKTKDSFRKGKTKLHKMIKAAQPFMAGSVAGPKAATQMKKVKSGFATPKIHKASQVKPIAGSMNLMKTAQESFLNGFGEEIHKEAQLGAALKGLVKGIAGAGKAGVTAGKRSLAATKGGSRQAISRYAKAAKTGLAQAGKKLTPGQAATVAGGAGLVGGVAS